MILSPSSEKSRRIVTLPKSNTADFRNAKPTPLTHNKYRLCTSLNGLHYYLLLMEDTKMKQFSLVTLLQGNIFGILPYPTNRIFVLNQELLQVCSLHVSSLRKLGVSIERLVYWSVSSEKKLCREPLRYLILPLAEEIYITWQRDSKSTLHRSFLQ